MSDFRTGNGDSCTAPHPDGSSQKEHVGLGGTERELKIKPVRDNHEQILRPEPLPHLLCPALEKDIGQKADPLIVRD